VKKNDASVSVASAVKNIIDVAIPRLPYSAPRLVPAAAFGSINNSGITPGIVVRRLLQTGPA
jgi:hypothetical protein